MALQLNTDISLSQRPLPTHSHLSRPHFNKNTFSLYPVHRPSINRGIFIDRWRVGEWGWVNGKIDAFPSPPDKHRSSRATNEANKLQICMVKYTDLVSFGRKFITEHPRAT